MKNNKTINLSDKQIFALCALSLGTGTQRYDPIIEHNINMRTLKALKSRDMIAWDTNQSHDRVHLTDIGKHMLEEIKLSNLFPKELL